MGLTLGVNALQILFYITLHARRRRTKTQKTDNDSRRTETESDQAMTNKVKAADGRETCTPKAKDTKDRQRQTGEQKETESD